MYPIPCNTYPPTMRLSCNGCRVLRKGCSDNCIIKPCLEWISSPECQANATLFLAKFYGRTGLFNLLTAAPQHLAPAIFRSLLYEASGRLVNPTYGSLGLFSSGEWARCEAAVDAVLTGSMIDGVSTVDSQTSRTLVGDNTHSSYDIRHVARGTNVDVREKPRFKKAAQVIKPKPQVGSVDSAMFWTFIKEKESVETVETSMSSRGESSRVSETEVNLELTLGFGCQSTNGKKRDY